MITYLRVFILKEVHARMDYRVCFGRNWPQVLPAVYLHSGPGGTWMERPPAPE